MKSNFKIKRNFQPNEKVYIPQLNDVLPLPEGTSTQFTIVLIEEDGITDKTTSLIVSYQHGKEKLKLAIKADKVYKIVPSAKCNHCNHEVCYEADKELQITYPYYCPNCDENLFGIEISLE